MRKPIGSAGSTFSHRLRSHERRRSNASLLRGGEPLERRACPAAVSVSGPASVSEGDTGSTAAIFTIELSEALTKPATVTYTVVGGSATAGSDYRVPAKAAGRISFAAGETKKSLTVEVIGDVARESTESFSVRLATPVNCTLGAAIATTSISDNDSYIMSVIEPAMMVPEGVPASVTIVLSSPATRNESFVCRAVNGTARSGLDFEIVTSRLVTFAPGQTSQTVSLKTFADGVAEGPERFIVYVKPLDARVGQELAATVFLTDSSTPEPLPPTVTLEVVTGAAAEAGTVGGGVRFTRTGDATAALTVGYLVGGTAVASDDYVPLAGQVTFAAGESTVDLPIVPVDDALVELPETVTLTLKSGSSYIVGMPVAATVTITSDDVTPPQPPTPPLPPPESKSGYQVRIVLPDNLSIDSKTRDNMNRMVDFVATKWQAIISGDLPDIFDSAGKLLVDDFELRVSFKSGPGDRPWQQPDFGGAWFTARRSKADGGLPYMGVAEITDKALTPEFYDGFKGGDKLRSYKLLALVGRAIGFNTDMMVETGLVDYVKYQGKGWPKPIVFPVITNDPPTKCAAWFSSPILKQVPFDPATWSDGVPFWTTALGGEGSFGFDVFVIGWESKTVRSPYVSNVTRGLLEDLGYRVRYAV